MAFSRREHSMKSRTGTQNTRTCALRAINTRWRMVAEQFPSGWNNSTCYSWNSLSSCANSRMVFFSRNLSGIVGSLSRNVATTN
jgi:hypothetical protein